MNNYLPTKVFSNYIHYPGSVSNVDKKDYKLYKEWFLTYRDQRLYQFISLVKSTPGYECWKGDFTPESIDGLNSFFKKYLSENVKVELKSEEEIKIFENLKREKFSPNKIPIDLTYYNVEYSELACSFLFDLALYMGQTLIMNHGLHWQQEFIKTKCDYLDNGSMMIPYKTQYKRGYSYAINPFWTVSGCIIRILSNSEIEDPLTDLYRTWEKIIANSGSDFYGYEDIELQFHE